MTHIKHSLEWIQEAFPALRKMQRKQGNDNKPCDNYTKVLKRPRSNVLEAIPNIDYGKKAIQVEPSDEDLGFLRTQT